jgi:hypothetical protein
MGELDEKVQEAIEKAPDSHLNSIVAIVVSVFATFMALGNIKDGNIVQAMAQAQAKMVDSWSYYQSKGMKRHLAQSMADQMQMQLDTQPSLTPAARAHIESKMEDYHKEAARYDSEQQEIKKQAEGLAAEYDRLNVHDDQFDMAEAALSVAIALAGVTALTRKRWLLILVFLFGGLGLVMGIAGFTGAAIHPDALARFLG